MRKNYVGEEGNVRRCLKYIFFPPISMWGAPLPLLPGGDARDTLREWFYAPATPERERSGDIACADFELVHCVHVKDPLLTSELAFPLDKQDPYTCALYLFYTTRPVMGTLTVLGAIGWRALVERHQGMVELSRDLVRTRAFLPLYEDEEAAPTHFIPLLPAFEPPADTTITVDELRARLSWYLGTGPPPPDPPADPAKEAAALYGAGVVCDALGAALFTIDDHAFMDMCAHETSLHAARMRLEEARFRAYADPLSEDQVIMSIAQSGHTRYMEEAMLVDARIEDRVAFFRRHPTRAPPTVCFLVPLEEVSVRTRAPLPIVNERGLARLCYADMGEWAWSSFCGRMQRMRFEAPVEWDERILKEARRVAQHYIDPPPAAKRRRVAVGGGDRRHAPTTAAAAVVHVVDHQELISLSPPCFAATMTAGRFPRHLERLRMLSTWQSAGVASSTVFEWFEAMNDAHPHPTVSHRGARARFDYEAAWKSELGPTYCANILRDMRSGRADSLACPMPAAAVGDIEDCGRACRAQCAPTETVPFSGPGTLIKRALWRRRGPVVTVAAEAAPVDDGDDFMLQEGSRAPFDDTTSEEDDDG